MKKAIYFTLALLINYNFLRAQDSTMVSLDTVANEVVKIQDDLTVIKKLKVSGWVQAQFQIANQNGVETYAGGSNFNPNVDKRFSVRRGRLKVIHDNGLSLYNMQIDISERNVQMREMFAKFTDPWTKAFSLTTGMFNRPFGYEISESSSTRPTPERARMSQSVFFNERDLGTWLTIQAPNTSRLHFLRIDAAMVSGTGITNVNNLGAAVANPNNNTNNNTSGGNDFDFQKDFIGRLSAAKTIKNEKIGISGGVSYYNGGYRTGNKKIYSDNGAAGFSVDSSDKNIGSIVKRIHYGADLQITIDNPLGMTTLRGEYIQGQLPGLGFRTYNSVPYSQPVTPIFIRNFNGAYFYFIQRIGTTKNTFVAKYDWYDPNVKVKGTQIGEKGSNTTSTDIRFNTLGIGWLYNWDTNIKLSVYYDMVKNESTQITTTNTLNNYSGDIKDNVVTFRVQYKF